MAERDVEAGRSPASAPGFQEDSAETGTIPLGEHTLVGAVVPGWILDRPLRVSLEQAPDGSVVAGDDLFLVYGVGATVEEALADYVVSLIDYYQLLAARLLTNPNNRPLFQQLATYLHPLNLRPAYAAQD